MIEFIKEKENVKLGEAVQIALQQVVGAYAIAVIDSNKPDEIVVAKLEVHFVLGLGKKNILLEVMLLLFLEFTKK